MKKLPFLAVAVVMGVGVLWACGSSSSGDDDSIIPYEAGPDVRFQGDTGVDATDPATGEGKAFCDATLGLIQKNLSQCCTAAEASGLKLDLYSKIATYLTQCETTLETSIAQHRTSPSPAEYQACTNAYAAAFALPPAANACQGLDAYRAGDTLSVSCAGAFVGKGAANAPCAGSFDCGGGLACIGYGAGIDGKCQTPAPADGTCAQAAAADRPAVDILVAPINTCASGFYCDTTCKPAFGPDAGCASNFECTGGACADGHCGGVAGQLAGPGGYCATNLDCVTGLFCDNAQQPPTDGGAPPGATGTCTASLPNGPATCDPTVPHQCQGKCGSGNVCATQCSYP